ncbi:MAG: hypothetical protein JNK33_04845 [Candidatus Doudnabacteria bacterium]|nr:hypothetical protein [Candidatus Doudnabacteria bacterium]
MADTNFQPIFDYIDNSRLAGLGREFFVEIKAEFREVKAMIVGLTNDVEKHHQEYLKSVGIFTKC